MPNQPSSPLIGIVGPCAAGKSTLIAKLEQHGIRARHIAQEHSFVPDMWKRITNPDFLVYLDVSYQVSTQRRKLDWTQAEYEEEKRRLNHAFEHADLYLFTDNLSPDDVFNEILQLPGLMSSIESPV